MRALITGIEGFTGRYVADSLTAVGCEIYGMARSPCSVAGVKRVFVVNLLNQTAVQAVVEKIRPNWVVHLAGISFVEHQNVADIYNTNIIGTRNLLEALLGVCSSIKCILLASSAHVYGNRCVGVIDELTTLAPANDYAVSKLAMENMAKLYSHALPIIITRPFNYTGVGQSVSFILPKIVNHFVNRAGIIELGNVDISREFSDVRMVSECYRRLLQAPGAIGGVFNICRGEAYSLLKILEIMESIFGYPIAFEIKNELIRVNEIKLLCGSRSHLESVIGPVIDIPLVDTLRWMAGLDANGY